MPDGRKAHETRRASELLRHREDQARDALVRAAALLTVGTREAKGEAIFHAALAMLRLAQSDPDCGAGDLAMEVLRAHRTPRAPGPYSGT